MNIRTLNTGRLPKPVKLGVELEAARKTTTGGKSMKAGAQKASTPEPSETNVLGDHSHHYLIMGCEK
jgi:hypothetical protein